MSQEQWVSAAGASSQWSRFEMISDNLANLSTYGYKANRTSYRASTPTGHKHGEMFAAQAGTWRDMRQGELESTGESFDFALRGNGFFTVQTATGTMLTRDGRFTLDQQGFVTTLDGNRVLGVDGEIALSPEQQISVDRDGNISDQTGTHVGRLQVAIAEATPVGHGLWQPNTPLVNAWELERAPQVEQGARERSNVDPIAMMVELVQAGRFFETFQKALQNSHDLDKRINRLGEG